ncbi:hypothetical protein POM88_031595 [Heracleum sosnowskyi]|uniref:Uncharacterized protein n=1 Tax=Heracleum sosnowskyi TaxID=360622 RepID=A0AAD8HZQ2_9APIA|nr:hypothetical protein POM88_031595 [Heracleum sosnowskyi]
MAEKKKESSSSAKSMEKTSHLDLDIGKDFLTSWKSMSVTEDDPMDFDFTKVTKGNKEAFKFDNLDMDFNLDNNFGQISSFNVDIPDLDVSFPVKKSAKPDKRPKEVSTDGKTHGKSNRSTFQFDFNEFDDLSFEPSSMKKAKQTNANKDEELPLSPSGSLGLKETTGESEGKTTSNFDSQLCAEPDSWSKEKLQTPLVEVHITSKSEISKYQATNMGEPASPQKPISNCTQETLQDNCPKERITSIEPIDKDKCRNSSVQSVSENSSTHQTASDSEEEVGCLSGEERTNTSSKQSLFHVKTDFGIDCGDMQINKLPVDVASSQSNDGENIQYSGDNPVQVDSKCNAEPGQPDSQIEKTSTSASKQVLCETEADGETMDLTSELVTQSNSETAGGGKQMSDPKCVTEVVRSKYFKGSDEAKSQLQQLSLSQTKIATLDSKRIETVQPICADKGGTVGDKAMPDEVSFKELDDTKSIPKQDTLSQVKVGAIGSQRITTSHPCTGDERKLDNKRAHSVNKFVSLSKSRPLPKEQTKGDLTNVRSQGTPSNQTSCRARFDSYDARRILTNTSWLHDLDVAKGEPVLNGTENNVKDLKTFREFHIKNAQSGRNSVVLPKAIPREKIVEDLVLTKSEGNYKEPTSNRTSTGTSMLHDKDADKGEVVSDGSRNNVKYLNTLSSHETPSSNEKTNRSASLLGLNPRLQVSGMKSTRNKITSPDTNEVSHLKDGIRASVLSNLNKTRTSEPIYPPSKSTLQNDTKFLTNSRQGAEVKESTRPRMVHHADTREQEPMSLTLKRKTIEESHANLVVLNPTKRLFISPRGSSFQNFRGLTEKLVNEENLPDGVTEKVLNNSQTSCLHFPQKEDMKELETSSDMNNESSVECAEACGKELDNLVNMLKKTHEEAKEILVRAVVNNNKLLMLNHPIYEEKFRMIEKFGALWLSKSVRPIGMAREALEAGFRQKMMMGDERKYEWPSRVSPGGPDPHHHYKND